MKEANALQHVAAFHRTFKHPVLDTPQIPSAQRCALRINLLQEELNELKEALENSDITEVADALCDLQYVLSGAILEFGLGEKFSDLFDEVQRSNMSKACKTLEDAEATVKYFEERDGEECFFREENGLYLVYRKRDNKTLKCIRYSPAQLEAILNGKSE